MITYKRAIEIVDEAFDQLIIDLIDEIDITRVTICIGEAELRNTLAFLLDSNYYHRRISEAPPDTDIASLVATRFRTILPMQDIERINAQRRGIGDEITASELSTIQEIDRSLNEYIFQSGIATNADITRLRTLIQEEVDYNTIIAEFISLGARLPNHVLTANLNMYYYNVQRLDDNNERVIQSILDRYITEEVEAEEADQLSDDDTVFSSVYGDNDDLVADPIGLAVDPPEDGMGLAGAFFYYHC